LFWQPLTLPRVIETKSLSQCQHNEIYVCLVTFTYNNLVSTLCICLYYNGLHKIIGHIFSTYWHINLQPHG